MNLIRGLLLAVALISLGGCAAGSVAISKRNLDVQNKMSETVFLTPSATKTVYVDVRNTSDKPNFNFGAQLKASLQGRGYTLVDDPEAAQYQLQANILQVGQVSQTAAQAATVTGFGSPLDGAIAGAATAAALNGNLSGRSIGAVGIAAGAADFIASNMVKDVYFSAVVDVQVSERTKGPVHVNGEQNLKQGTSGGDRVTYDEQTNYKRYRTRVISTANKVNLKWDEAEPVVLGGLTQSISGLF
ncbi:MULTISPECIES: complement resistance protein TraT [unclassified Dyella]|jgi:hypothetical protein|uniref:complement resistance protein TraT n=1 Tax=Dyella sp. ASV21 TaxID=2795114 RepID=UPI0018EBF7F7|nr:MULTISPECIES: complement resistance protein TraT [unclassified Dyella]